MNSGSRKAPLGRSAAHMNRSTGPWFWLIMSQSRNENAIRVGCEFLEPVGSLANSRVPIRRFKTAAVGSQGQHFIPVSHPLGGIRYGFRHLGQGRDVKRNFSSELLCSELLRNL